MKRLIRLITALLLPIIILFGSVLPVYAIADPDSPPSINAVYVYEDLLETGDVGVLIDYYLDYDFTLPITGEPVPDETVTEAYMAVFIDVDGTTNLKAVAPYTFVNSGYGRGLVWIYFTKVEATAASLDSADIALYSIWLMGNPTLAWSGDPPKTIANIDEWHTSATCDPSVLLGLKVLYYADQLEIIWGYDLIQVTPLGNKLTTTGEEYFDNAIPSLRIIAPNVYASGEFDPTLEGLDYSTTLGAIMTNVTGTVTGSPITLAFGSTMTNVTGSVAGSPIVLVDGVNTVNVEQTGTFNVFLVAKSKGTAVNGTGQVNGSPVALAVGANIITVPAGGTGTLIITVVHTVNVTNFGTFTIELAHGTTGTIADGVTGNVVGTPVALVSGVNTVSVLVGDEGDLNISVNKVDTETSVENTIVGTGFDLTEVATAFGMSRWMFSGLVWLIISIIICAAVYRISGSDQLSIQSGSGKTIMIVFDVCIIGGVVLGLMHPLVAVLMFIGWSALTGYVIFFSKANI